MPLAGCIHEPLLPNYSFKYMKNCIYGSFHNYVESERLQRLSFLPKLDDITVLADRNNCKISTPVTQEIGTALR